MMYIATIKYIPSIILIWVGVFFMVLDSFLEYNWFSWVVLFGVGVIV